MVDEEVAFTDMSTGEGITTWDWTFGDEATSTDQNPTHTYTAAGTYTVSLTVWRRHRHQHRDPRRGRHG